MSTETGTGERVRRRWQHLSFGSWLVLAMIGPLAGRMSSGRDVLLPLLLIVLLAAWYTGWLVLGPARRSVYLVGAGALWLSLLAVDRSFLLMGLIVFAPFCVESRRVGFTVVGLCGGGCPPALARGTRPEGSGWRACANEPRHSAAPCSWRLLRVRGRPWWPPSRCRHGRPFSWPHPKRDERRDHAHPCPDRR